MYIEFCYHTTDPWNLQIDVPLKIIKIKNYNQVDSEKVTMLLILFHNISTEFKVHCQL